MPGGATLADANRSPRVRLTEFRCKPSKRWCGGANAPAGAFALSDRGALKQEVGALR